MTISTQYHEYYEGTSLSATEFKAKCLACLDEIEQCAESITITRRGRPIAVLGPVKRKKFKSSKNSLAGKIKILGDIVSPPAVWDAAGPE